MEPSETNLRVTLLERRIHDLRGHNVMLDHDLAAPVRVNIEIMRAFVEV